MLKVKLMKQTMLRAITLSVLIMLTWCTMAVPDVAHANDGARVCVFGVGKYFVRINIGSRNKDECQNHNIEIYDEVDSTQSHVYRARSNERRVVERFNAGSGRYRSCEEFAREYTAWSEWNPCTSRPITTLISSGDKLQIHSKDVIPVEKLSKDTNIKQLKAHPLTVDAKIDYSYGISRSLGASFGISIAPGGVGVNYSGSITWTNSSTQTYGYQFRAGEIPGVKIDFPDNDPYGYQARTYADLNRHTKQFVKGFANVETNDMVVNLDNLFFQPKPGGDPKESPGGYYAIPHAKSPNNVQFIPFGTDGTPQRQYVIIRPGLGPAEATIAAKDLTDKYNYTGFPDRAVHYDGQLVTGYRREIEQDSTEWRDYTNPVTWSLSLVLQSRT